jgi:hypothetical protein
LFWKQGPFPVRLFMSVGFHFGSNLNFMIFYLKFRGF